MVLLFQSRVELQRSGKGALGLVELPRQANADGGP